uniref:Periplasmic nitrate reductase, electron transfer subunit n=1 Tax=Candidatus Kentrum sp. MB TaxID=2138164 RepID=A0A451B9L7_9GAMM|nr:MAG: periplasmic nitrate reductase subunit NapB [Candidatus Kentron sp. MB]VFK74980.1 MAG: periplasmic nitrate reductase subunit NapB [Candidatus Kentron sp. MB]
MKKLLQITIMGAVLFPWVVGNVQAELQSLRGSDIQSNSASSEVRRYIDNERSVERGFIQQPPMIPHKIQGYRINLRTNKCLSCHSWANYKKKKATKISITHFRDRHGKELSDVSSTRYFCTQCHVPQTDMPALVENQFQPVNALDAR